MTYKISIHFFLLLNYKKTIFYTIYKKKIKKYFQGNIGNNKTISINWKVFVCLLKVYKLEQE